LPFFVQAPKGVEVRLGHLTCARGEHLCSCSSSGFGDLKRKLWHWAGHLMGLCESLGQRRDLTVALEASLGSSLKLHLAKWIWKRWTIFLLLVFGHRLSLL